MTFSPAGLFILVGSGASWSSLFAQFQGQNWPIASCSAREFHQEKGKKQIFDSDVTLVSQMKAIWLIDSGHCRQG
ncbi:hypothetical protein LZ32DRAFT_603197 [Colletotrichum eremochloae]|nr:hypothetical protein LZ32DRAFT_603197 [Colletotrichum eremochloae]